MNQHWPVVVILELMLQDLVIIVMMLESDVIEITVSNSMNKKGLQFATKKVAPKVHTTFYHAILVGLL